MGLVYSMSRVTTVPRSVLEAAWRAGLGGRRIRIPVREDDGGHLSSIVRDLLVRAERRVLECGDAHRDSIRQAWATERDDAERFEVSPSLIWKARCEAEAEIRRWWRGGEGRRYREVQSMGARSLGAYRRVRRELRTLAVPPSGTDPRLVELAMGSVEAAWWGRNEQGGPDLAMAEEAAFMASCALLGVTEVGETGRLLGVRLGARSERAREIVRRVEVGIARGRRAAGERAA